MLIRTLCVRSAVLGFMSFVSANSTFAAYQLVSLADNSGPFARATNVGVNSNGTVVVQWLMDSGSHSIDVYGTGSRNIGFGGTQQTKPYFSVSSPSINSSGQVAFYGLPYSSLLWKLYRDTAGSKVSVQEFASSDTFDLSTSINDSGVIAFTGTISPHSSSVYRSYGTLIARAGTDGFVSVFEATINNSGTVAFRANRSGSFGAYAGNGGAITTIADSSGAISSVRPGPVSLNALGMASFSVNLDDGRQAVYIGNGTILTPIIDTTGEFSDFGSTSINSFGQVAFNASLDGGGSGVYLAGPNSTATKVVGTGDSLFGSTVTSAIINNDSMNDLGQIAIIYGLSNGVRGVALASVVPEPGMLGGLMLCGLLLRRRRTGYSL